MKHNIKITALILAMFIITQIIGLVVIHADPLKIQSVDQEGTVTEVTNPYLEWVSPPEPETQTEYVGVFSQILIAFVIAVLLLFFLMKFKIEYFLRFWFFAVVCIALFLCFIAFAKIVPWEMTIKTALIASIVLAIPLAYIKIYRRNIIVHNLTELLIYPGIAVVFVPILNFYTIIALLLVISGYDMWAVWHTGIMQKMAKYQINQLKIFSGFFVPYLNQRQKLQMQRTKTSKYTEEKKVKVNVAILGGGDIIFPIITAGVVYVNFGLLSAIFVPIGAVMGLGYLFFLAEKKKFYPAMPFISAGMFVGMLIGLLI
jgi:presenilin-like A22 family membrane protease